MRAVNEARKTLIIFDFDGVVADSEMLANTVLAELVTELGAPMTAEASLATFVGKRLDEVVAGIGVLTNTNVGPHTGAELTRRTIDRFRRELREVDGLRGYLAAFEHIDRCIASSSSPERLAACLGILGLQDVFGLNVYSASLVPRGKPHPDLFLHAAAQLSADPARTIVIEDSEAGVRAATAARMIPIGFLGGSHVRAGHEERLRSAGARFVAHDYGEAEQITRALLK